VAKSSSPFAEQNLPAPDDDPERARIVLDLLQSIEKDGALTQRSRASELGIALGLLNSYLRRCVSKGLLKVSKAPARRYAYYLTPRGFLEKSRLTVQYLSISFDLFRRARSEYSEIFRKAHARGYTHCALAGVSDLAEIATLCAIEANVKILGVVDASARVKELVRVPVYAALADLPDKVEALVVTDVRAAQRAWGDGVTRFGASRVFAPPLLEIQIGDARQPQ
jgi:predicted transcriptional regulator